jgi:hypothetical protein
VISKFRKEIEFDADELILLIVRDNCKGKVLFGSAQWTHVKNVPLSGAEGNIVRLLQYLSK